MPTALIGAAITGGASLAGGLLSKPKKTVTQPLYTPEQQSLQSTVAGTLQNRLANPTNLDPLKTAAASSLNRSYDSAQTGLEQRLAARGFGNSGKLVTNTKNLEIARAGGLGDLESKFAGMQIDQNNRTLEDAQRFAFSGPGSQTTQNQPGGPLGGAIGGATDTATLLYALNHFLSGGGPRPGVGSGESPYSGGGLPGGSDGDFGGEVSGFGEGEDYFG